jgi:hypothetical protein
MYKRIRPKLSSYGARENVGTGVWHAQGEAAIHRNGIDFTAGSEGNVTEDTPIIFHPHNH